MRADTFTSGPDQGGRSRGNRSAPPPSSRLQPADLADTRCPDCGHPRTGCGCSCTGPGTCGGGTDDVEPQCGDSLIFYCTLPRGHEDSHYSDDLPKWRWE